MENTSFCRFSASLYCQDQFLSEFWTPVDWVPYSPDLNQEEFSIRHILQGKVQVTSMPIWLLYIHPSPQNRTS
jgi:hypothetical protein